MRRALGLLVLVCSLARADTAPVLDRFYAQTQALQGRFTQTVAGADGKVFQRGEGRFWLRRPGLFRWDYETPYIQRIVADGTRLWVYEPELEQVTVRVLSDDAGDVPGLLLAGATFPDELFELRSAALGDDGWVELAARSDQAGVSSVRIRFAHAVPQELSFTDALGQTTRLSFTDLERNGSPRAGVFEFTPPPGTDVVGDAPADPPQAPGAGPDG